MAEDERPQALLSYVDAVVERDAAALQIIRRPDALRRLVEQVAGRTAQELSMEDLCRAVGARRESVSAWLDLLERLGLMQRVGSWADSPSARDIRRPRMHMLDTGLACALRGEDAVCLLAPTAHASVGALMETWVFTELQKIAATESRRWTPWHWRRDRREIDLIWTAPGRPMVLIEVKSTTRVSADDARHLRWFMEEGPAVGRPAVGIVFHAGTHVLPLGGGVVGLPVSLLAGQPTSDLEARGRG
jgi:predicted AAA+ superfamily ATPase